MNLQKSAAWVQSEPATRRAKALERPVPSAATWLQGFAAGRALSWALRTVRFVGHACKGVLRLIVEAIGRHTEGWPTQPTLAADAGCSERTVRSAVRELERRGFLTTRHVLPGQRLPDGRVTLSMRAVYAPGPVLRWFLAEAPRRARGRKTPTSSPPASARPKDHPATVADKTGKNTDRADRDVKPANVPFAAVARAVACGNAAGNTDVSHVARNGAEVGKAEAMTPTAWCAAAIAMLERLETRGAP